MCRILWLTFLAHPVVTGGLYYIYEKPDLMTDCVRVTATGRRIIVTAVVNAR